MAVQQSPSSAGELIKTFRHGQVFVYYLLILGFALLGVAGFVVYLSTIVPQKNPPLFFGTAGFLVVCSLASIAGSVWQKKLRQASYEVYEKGVVQIIGAERKYTAFRDIQDLYLFSSGQMVMTGMVTNLAYRRNAGEPFTWISQHLGRFEDFQQLFRELYLRERQPAVFDTLVAGGAVTFNYVSTGQVWRKRVSGKFLDITTETIVLTRDALEVQGQKIALASLRDVNLNAWSEKVVIKDANGKTVLSTIALGILGMDLFLNTLSLLLQDEAQAAA